MKWWVRVLVSGSLNHVRASYPLSYETRVCGAIVRDTSRTGEFQEACEGDLHIMTSHTVLNITPWAIAVPEFKTVFDPSTRKAHTSESLARTGSILFLYCQYLSPCKAFLGRSWWFGRSLMLTVGLTLNSVRVVRQLFVKIQWGSCAKAHLILSLRFSACQSSHLPSRIVPLKCGVGDNHFFNIV